MIVIGTTTATANGDLENLTIISIACRRVRLATAVGLFVTALSIDNLPVVVPRRYHNHPRLRDLGSGRRGRESTVVSMGWLIGTCHHVTTMHYAEGDNWPQKIKFIPKNLLCNQICSEVNPRF